MALKAGRIHYDGTVQALSGSFLNDLYDGDLDVELLMPTREQHQPDMPLPVSLVAA